MDSSWCIVSTCCIFLGLLLALGLNHQIVRGCPTPILWEKLWEANLGEEMKLKTAVEDRQSRSRLKVSRETAAPGAHSNDLERSPTRSPVRKKYRKWTCECNACKSTDPLICNAIEGCEYQNTTAKTFWVKFIQTVLPQYDISRTYSCLAVSHPYFFG